jgi:NADPH:quinone reductase-like Zn-dependent oxidoreductase
MKLGLQLGAYADFAVADESQVGLAPKAIPLAEAGTLPLVALTSYQALSKTLPWPTAAGAPWTVVITSGSGGTGFVAVQIAKAWGATEIITAAGPEDGPWLKALGATQVFDYHKGPIWAQLGNGTVDVVYDNYGAAGTADLAMPKMKPGGVFIWLPGHGGGKAKHPRPDVKEINYGLCDASKYEDLDALAALAEKGQLVAKVSQWFGLADIPAAFNQSQHGKAVGKIGISIAH